jgi:hypothetical protein
MEPKPRFIQGLFSFEGKGLSYPVPLEPSALYAVPRDKHAKLIYLRAGNSTSDLVSLALTHDGAPVRFFPIAPKASVHVPFAVAENVMSESQLEILVCAASGSTGHVVLDLGLMETS